MTPSERFRLIFSEISFVIGLLFAAMLNFEIGEMVFFGVLFLIIGFFLCSVFEKFRFEKIQKFKNI